MKDVLKCLLMYQDAAITGHLIQVNGLVVIWDAKTLSWRHILQLTPSTIFCMTSLLFAESKIPCALFIPKVLNIIAGWPSSYGGNLPLWGTQNGIWRSRKTSGLWTWKIHNKLAKKLPLSDHRAKREKVRKIYYSINLEYFWNEKGATDV
ncbi:uncharacterized protein LOC111641060 isoform X2 [Centruroides sculpturatus]|uniref:uncharacterized protein LOC111641060 isoform X2 n=1 Tax=Centruroides sculpturatus TaxID=218467 RepID=UPI000C6C95DB|nr:uncharacterized protein LOC111641060 isoform X2 [Centruroides sculpturatus]